MYKFLLLFCLLIPLKLKSQFEFGISATSGIVRTYHHVIPSVDLAPTFKSKNMSKYSYGIFLDFKLYKNLFLSIGTEHKYVVREISQDFMTNQSTQNRFSNLGDVGINIGLVDKGYWSFPLRISYKQFLNKNRSIFMNPNIGFCYQYNSKIDRTLINDPNTTSVNDTSLLFFEITEKKFSTENIHLFQFQIGAEIGWKHKFFSVYLGVNYSKGLNKMFVYKLESTEKDLYANTPAIHYSETLESRGSNLNSYLGMRFQLYPIAKAKKKIALE